MLVDCHHLLLFCFSLFHYLKFVIHYFRFVNFTDLFQPCCSPSGGPAKLEYVQCKPVGLRTKCSIELLVANEIEYCNRKVLSVSEIWM